jgi:23S rRNA pseudouridine1911/1915/1917 synthase
MRTDGDVAVKANPKVPVSVVHEDPDLIIVAKEAGVVTQPGKGHAEDSLLNGVFALRDGAMGKFLTNLGVRRDWGLLHRLDRETSGLLVIAKTPNAYDQLRRDFEERRVDKEYWAMTAGIPKPGQGVVQARLKEMVTANPEGRGTIKKVLISKLGQEAISAYKVDASVPGKKGDAPAALVHVRIKTGRLHQIRAHMTFLNCVVLGDDLYGVPGIDLKRYPEPPRLCLHAGRLGFKHPSAGKWMHYESPLPEDLHRYAQQVGLAIHGT